MNTDNIEFSLLRKKTQDLSDLFALREGRRPRVLIGGEYIEIPKSLNSIGNTFADMGCNVDIAPLNNDLQLSANQSIENDIDMLLILTDKIVDLSKLEKLQDTIFEQEPRIVLSLYSDDSIYNESLENTLKQWGFFDQNSNRLSITFHILNKLLQISE